MRTVNQSKSLTLIVQPIDRETSSVFDQLGFRSVAIVPQLLFRTVDRRELALLFVTLCQQLSQQGQNSRYIVTHSLLDAKQLLIEFLNAQPLNRMTRFVKHAWFFQVLAQRQLFFNYQPIFSLATGEIVAHECLARAENEQGQQFSGQQLIDAALTMNLTNEFDQLARSTCFSALAQWNTGDRHQFFINVLPNAIARHPDSIEQNLQQVLDLGLRPAQIVFEFTEIEALEHHPHLSRLIEQIRAWGFGVALDDLGSNVAIDHYCTEFHPDVIKLDRRLIQDCSRYSMKQVMVRSLMQVAQELGILVLAEGLETVEDIQFCRDIGVDLAQGFGLGMPSEAPMHDFLNQSGKDAIHRVFRDGLIQTR